MAAGSLLRKLPSWGFLARSQTANFHSSSSYGALKSSDGKFQVTLLPGDGVGPELMDSVQVGLLHYILVLCKIISLKKERG